MPAVVHGLKPYTVVEEAFAKACRLLVRQEVAMAAQSSNDFPKLYMGRPPVRKPVFKQNHEKQLEIRGVSFISISLFVLKYKTPVNPTTLYQWLVLHEDLIQPVAHPTHRRWKIYNEQQLHKVYTECYLPNKRKTR